MGARVNASALALLLSVAACSSSSKAGPSASASAASARPPGVVVDAEGTWLDGVRVDDPPANALTKIDGLFTAAKARRDAFAAKNGPGEPDPIPVVLPAGASCQVGMSVLQTLSYVGYRRTTLDAGGAKHDVAMFIPPPPDVDALTIARVVHVRL